MERPAVLTTGANSGIGLATAIELARRRFRSIGSVRSAEKAESVRQAAHEAGVEVETVILDVTDATRCTEVMSELDLYALVNNAGYSLTGAIEDTTDEQARQLFETMVLAPMRLARLAIPKMRQRGDGRIVNISSLMGRISAPFSGWYSAAKHSLETLSDSLRTEVARDGIKVVLIEPGGFKTGIWDEFERALERLEQQGSRNGAAYERFLRYQKMVEPIMGNPTHCAKVVANAIESRSPRDRYLVGLDAQMLTLVTHLTPNSIQDRIVRLALGI